MSKDQFDPHDEDMEGFLEGLSSLEDGMIDDPMLDDADEENAKNSSGGHLDEFEKFVSNTPDSNDDGVDMSSSDFEDSFLDDDVEEEKQNDRRYERKEKNTPENLDALEKIARETNDPKDETGEHDDDHYGGNIDELIALASQDSEIDNDTAAVRKQFNINKHNAVDLDSPADILLIDEPTEVVEDKEVKDGAGDLNLSKGIMAFSAVILTIVFGMGVFFGKMFLTPEETIVAGPSGEKSIGAGNIIESINGSGSSNNGGNNSSDSGGSSDSENKGEEKSDSSSSSSNKMDVSYQIKTEGDIKAASVSYIGSVGATQQETGVTLPWEETIQADKSVNPQMAVSTVGRGTVTCTIEKDGKEIVAKTASGESPTVECKK